MPVPPKKQELYGKVAGHMQNLGYSLSEAKEKADSAIKGSDGKNKSKSRKGSSKKQKSNGY